MLLKSTKLEKQKDEDCHQSLSSAQWSLIPDTRYYFFKSSKTIRRNICKAVWAERTMFRSR